MPSTSPRLDRVHRAGLWWAFLGVVLFSFSLPLTKVAVGGFDPLLTATGRALIAGALATVVLVALRVPWPERRHLRPLLFVMAGAVFGWPILLALALTRTTSAHAAVIAAFMPLTTAIIAVTRGRERVPGQFWAAAVVGTGALVAFALSRGGAEGGDLIADLLIVGAVVSSSWCYVEGAAVAREIPGWQVISWVVVLALPITVPATIVLWLTVQVGVTPTATEWGALILLGVFSMYVGFFAWYRGLAMAGSAYGGQVQQVQAPLTLLWSAVFLGEVVTWATAAVAAVVIGSVAWAQRSRAPTVIVPEE